MVLQRVWGRAGTCRTERPVLWPRRALAGDEAGANVRGCGTPELKVAHTIRTFPDSEVGRHPPTPCALHPARVSRTSWRSNRAGFVAVSPRGTDRSPLPARHSLRPHGFLLRASTAGALQLAFVVRRRPQGFCNGNHRSTGFLCSSPRCGTGPKGTSGGPRWRSGVRQATRAKLSPPHLTPGCSGLAALAAEPIG